MRTSRILTLMILVCAATLVAAQSNQTSEYDLLKPGSDSNLSWVGFQQAARKAFDEKKPVLIYFYAKEKTTRNAQSMIAAQFRLFPEEEVKEAAGDLVCAMADIDTRKQAMEEEESAAGKARADGKDEGEPEDEAIEAPSSPLPAAQWPEEPAIYLVDYRGRLIQKLTKVPTSSKKFAASLASAVKTNQRNVLLDQKAAEKAAREKARREAREAEKAAREEKAREEEDKSDDDPSDDE